MSTSEKIARAYGVLLARGEKVTVRAVQREAGVRIGEVELEVVRLAAPCRVMEESIGPGGRTALRRRGGSVLRVLHGGTVRVGDRVDLPSDPPGMLAP